MPIQANTRIKLGSSEPKTKAVVAAPGTAATGSEVAIWAAANIDPALTQSIVGDFRNLLAWAKSNMPAIKADGSDPVVVWKGFGRGDADFNIGGTPAAGDIRLEIGSEVADGSKSHFLHRTVNRLIERWLEESKTGVEVVVPPPPQPGNEPTIDIESPMVLILGGKWQPGTTITVTVRLTDPDSQTDDTVLTIVIPPGAPADGWDANTAASVVAGVIEAEVNLRATATGDRVVMSPAAPANSVEFLSVSIA